MMKKKIEDKKLLLAYNSKYRKIKKQFRPNMKKNLKIKSFNLKKNM